MREGPSAPRASVIVPAHDEAAVIGRCLAALAPGIASGDLEVIVVANGCTDDTAASARAFRPAVRVIERAEAGKGAALDAGRAAATAPVHVHLDGDLVATSDAVLALVRPIEAGEALAACGAMDVDLEGASPLVRAFYAVWALNPYFDGGKFGGLFAIAASETGRIGAFAGHVADDELARRAFAPCERAFVPGCRFTARAPRRLGDLVKVRRRSRRGTRRLEAGEGGGGRPGATATALARRLAVRPRLWPAAVVYLAVTLKARIDAMTEPAGTDGWERDDSARRPAR